MWENLFMGMYDYLGEHQVKCFGVPTVGITPDGDSFKLFIHCMGGNLRYYRRGSAVPYKTPFYNYGKDFMVFDFRTFNFNEPIYHDDLKVHIIKNGRYFRSVRYDRVPSRYEIGLVLNNYGEVVNIKTHNDFKEIVYDWRYSQMKYRELSEKYRKEQGIIDVLALNVHTLKELNLSSEELNELFDKSRQCQDRAAKESLDLFRKTWFEGTEEIDANMNKGWPFGALYDALENMTHSEYDKYWIARLFVEEVEKKEKSLMFALGEYFYWCIKNDIEVNKLKFMSFFSKYLREIPEEVVKEYENSSEKAFREKVYGKKAVSCE